MRPNYAVCAREALHTSPARSFLSILLRTGLLYLGPAGLLRCGDASAPGGAQLSALLRRSGYGTHSERKCCGGNNRRVTPFRVPIAAAGKQLADPLQTADFFIYCSKNL